MTVLYVLSSPEFAAKGRPSFKLGITGDLERRMKQVAAIGITVAPVAVFSFENRADARQVETSLKRSWAEKRPGGSGGTSASLSEWFHLTEADIDSLREQAQAAGGTEVVL